LKEAIKKIISDIGDDPAREGLLETPSRVVNSFRELYSGYNTDPREIIKIFSSKDSCDYDQMVLLKNIEMYSMCEHHLLPFFGKAHIAYIPDSSVIGISKLARILEMYSRRLQIQERLTCQIVDCLMENLRPKGAACVIEACHFCMMARGISKQNSIMVTSSLKGVFLDDEKTRFEFLETIKR